MPPQIQSNKGSALQKISSDIDMVINSLKFAEKDPDTSYQSAALIQLCINQLNNNLRCLNEEFGSAWPENKL